MPFVKGQSGNPGGRVKQDVNVRDMCRAHTAMAVKTLVEIAENPDAPPSARTTAAQYLLDRGWGRPAQAVEVTGEGGGPVTLRVLIEGGDRTDAQAGP